MPKKPAGKKTDFVFSRVDARRFEGKIADHFMDTSFEAKQRYGQSANKGEKSGDSYGEWSNTKLADK